MTTMTIEPARERLEQLGAKRILCAVSGGMDSMCLLHVVLNWGRENGAEVLAAHFNHQLRGPQADRDEAFVQATCEKWDVRCICGRGNVGQLAQRENRSVEEAARLMRYDFLNKTAEQERCDVILTAHHADDNAETMLLNLVRGTGLRGLAGIPPTRERIARIFLDTTREELAAYAAENGIDWVDDETNFDPDAAARNLVRLKIMPLLREVNPKAVEHMSRTADELWEIHSMLDERIQWITWQEAFISGKGLVVAREVLRNAPQPVRAGVLLNLFERLGAGRRDVGSVHIHALEALLEKDEGMLNLPNGVTAWCEGKWLRLRRNPPAPGRKRLLENSPLCWGPYQLTLLDHPEGEGLALTADGPLEVGPCSAGERLHLPEGRGARTVKRLCLDRGISLMEREKLPAIYTENTLAAVWRLGVDIQFLPEGKTRRFIQIKNTEEKKHEK